MRSILYIGLVWTNVCCVGEHLDLDKVEKKIYVNLNKTLNPLQRGVLKCAYSNEGLMYLESVDSSRFKA